MDISETIKFRHICDIVEKIKTSNKIKSKETILARYYESFQRHRLAYRQQMGAAGEEPENGSSSFYSVLRCLMPQEDRSRRAYDLQITALGAVYIKVLQIPEDSREAVKLRARSYTGKYEDYADIVFNVLRSRCREESSNLTLKQVHDMLDSIASGDRRNTEMILTNLFEVASAQEQKWFIRLILKSMSLGIGEQRIFSVLHPQAKELYQRCSNLQRVCNLLADNKIAEAAADVPELNLNSVIEPFQPIKPMLCERFPGDIEQVMATDVLYMETKMDGERFQLHFANERFMYISRNGIDYTSSFGHSFDEGKYTPLLRDIWPIGLKSMILDGEMMVWDMQNERFREKGENTDVKHLSNNPNWRPCFVVYDLLYLNGKSLLDMSYAQRSYRMQELIKEQDSVLQKMKPKKVGSVEEFMELFKAAIEAKAEGIVLKKQNSTYKPGVRFGGGWYKDKADYIKGLTTEFDLLIIGGFYNRTRTFIESFLLGVLHEKSPELHEVYSVGKVANVIRQRANLNSLLKPHWKPIEREPPPLWYHYVANNAEGRPDVWIQPQHSTILQIRAADLSPSGAFALAKALHFPRIDAWRNDKIWNECMSLKEFKDMYQGQNGLKKLDKRETRLEDFTIERKRLKLTPAEKRKLGMLAYEKRIDAKEIEKTSDLLEGFYVCILSGSLEKGYPPERLKALAVSNGAEIVENPLPNEPKCINVAGDENFRIELLKKSKRYDIVGLKWLLRVCERQHLKLNASDMISMTPALEKQFAKMQNSNEVIDVDMDEDSSELRMVDEKKEANSTHLYTVEEVQQLFDAITVEELNEFELEAAELSALERQLYDNNSPNIFAQCSGYFLHADCKAQLAKLQFTLRSGICVPNHEALCDAPQGAYIFANISNCDSDKLRAWCKAHKEFIERNSISIVNINWILHSYKAKRLLNLSDYRSEDLM